MKKQGFLLSSAILISSVIITKILGLIYKIPLTNILGGEGYGYYSVAYSVFMPVFSIAVSGITQAVAKLVSENCAFERYRNVRKIRRVALIFFSLMGIFFTVISFAVAYPVCVCIIKVPQTLWSVIAISPCIFIAAVMAVERGYYEGLRNMTPTAVSEVLESIFKIVFGLGFAFWASKNSERFFISGLPFVSACTVFGVTTANFLSGISVIIYHKVRGDGITKQMISGDSCTDRMRDLLGSILKISTPIAIASVITTLGSFIDTITISHSLRTAISRSPEYFMNKFGVSVSLDNLPNFIYGSFNGIALTVFGLVPSVTSIFGKSILPIISEEWAKEQKLKISQRINSLLFITSVSAFPCAMGIYTFCGEILKLLFPTKESEIIACGDCLKILCVGMIFLCLAMPLYSVIQIICNPEIAVRIMGISCIVKMFLNLILVAVPSLNIVGAAIATTISYGLIFLVSLYELINTCNLKIQFRKIFVKPFFSAFMCVMSARSCYDLLIIHTGFAFTLGISIIFGGIIYIFSLYLLSVLTKNELKSLVLK